MLIVILLKIGIYYQHWKKNNRLQELINEEPGVALILDDYEIKEY